MVSGCVMKSGFDPSLVTRTNLAKGEVLYGLDQLWYGFEGLRVLNQAKRPGLPHCLQEQRAL